MPENELHVDQCNVVTEADLQSKDWFAWNNLMPPPPNDFHVTGEVLVANPGVVAVLTPMEPQGINPAILLLELRLVQQPGIWPSVMTWVPARYDKVYGRTSAGYSQVTIFHGGNAIADIPVMDVH